jgi:hypothetical protein
MNKRFVCQHCAGTYPDFDVAHVCSRGPYAPKLKLKKNERIKELAHEAGLPTYNPEGIPTKLEKFAELIVRECAKRVDYWESRQGEHADDLLKHFGVEE